MNTQKMVQCLSAALVVLLLASCQQLPPSVTNTPVEPVPLNYLPALQGGYFKLDSNELGRPFHIYIRLPSGYSEGNKSYPVVYVLDGDSLFPILAGNHLFLTYDDGVPEAIVVGISYGSFDQDTNKRGVDFTAPGADARQEQGGAPLFHKFLELELLPTIEKQYRADAEKRILFGQSRGGFMVLYSAFTAPDLFWGRIASNPTFSPGGDLLFSPPTAALRENLKLIVTSGTRDYPSLRAAALGWNDVWSNRDNLPWAIHFISLDNGTHAANSTDSYRKGLLWLFDQEK